MIQNAENSWAEEVYETCIQANLTMPHPPCCGVLGLGDRRLQAPNHTPWRFVRQAQTSLNVKVVREYFGITLAGELADVLGPFLIA